MSQLQNVPSIVDQGEDIQVLHIDDEEDLLDLAKEYLELENQSFEIVTETDTQSGLERLKQNDIDCVVCDYNMPGMNGIQLLEKVREEHPDLPFILFTGKGSEEVASDAISAGVTDYLQKEVGPDQYTVLANRIENAVNQHRVEQEIAETRDFYGKILDYSSDFVIIVDEGGVIKYVSPAVTRVMGYPPDELLGTNSFDFPHPEDRQRAFEALDGVLDNPREEHTVEYRAKHNDGSWRWIEVRGQSLLDDPVINGIMVNVRDITERKQREQDLEEQNKRLEDLTSFLEHDVRNQLNIIRGRIDLVKESIATTHYQSITDAISRIEEMFENVMELAHGTDLISNLEPVTLRMVIDQCWPSTDEAELEVAVDSEYRFEADPERLRSLLENLFRNAVQHAGPDVTVTVGTIENSPGFYVEDDGPGIPEEDREHIHDSDYSKGDGGSGLGLTIVKQIVDAHGWEIDVTSGEDGGARFEVTGLELVE